MIEFKRMHPEQRALYDCYLTELPERGCEYSFTNKYLWGKQQMAFLHGCVAFFSHFYGKSIYRKKPSPSSVVWMYWSVFACTLSSTPPSWEYR